MVKVANIRDEKLFDSHNAIQPRKLAWEDHLKRACCETGTYNNKGSHGRHNRSLITTKESTSLDNHNNIIYEPQLTNNVKKFDHSSRSLQKYAIQMYESSQNKHQFATTDLAHNTLQKVSIERAVRIKFVSKLVYYGPRIMLRLIKLNKNKFRLGVIVYGATLDLVNALRKFVATVTQSGGLIKSGYVNGIKCSENEEKT